MISAYATPQLSFKKYLVFHERKVAASTTSPELVQFGRAYFFVCLTVKIKREREEHFLQPFLFLPRTSHSVLDMILCKIESHAI